MSGTSDTISLGLSTGLPAWSGQTFTQLWPDVDDTYYFVVENTGYSSVTGNVTLQLRRPEYILPDTGSTSSGTWSDTPSKATYYILKATSYCPEVVELCVLTGGVVCDGLL